VHFWAGTLPIAWWIPGMSVAAATMFGFIYFGLDASARGAGVVAARAFVLGELAASVYWQLSRFYSGRFDESIEALGAVVIYGVLFTLVAFVERNQFNRSARLDAGGASLLGAVAIAIATFGI